MQRIPVPSDPLVIPGPRKGLRFIWRTSRNLLCLTPAGRHFLFPPNSLAAGFGPADAGYAWHVFEHHRAQLAEAGFCGARRILEVGPGRNLGTALLWWAGLGEDAQVTCWDVFANAQPGAAGFWRELAASLLEAHPGGAGADTRLRSRLGEICTGRDPHITYVVSSLSELVGHGDRFDLVFSQAAVEHIWFVDEFWRDMAEVTDAGGWHSHRIDLSDHGHRDSNYIEMLEWSRAGYWITMRAVPGAVNRWRACQHLERIRELGFEVLVERRSRRSELPIPLRRVAPEFRALGEAELRTVALDVVARKAH